MKCARYRRSLAIATAVALLLGASPTVAGTDTGILKGRIFTSDGQTPLSGATVRAANLTTEAIYDSLPTDGHGRFSLAELPSGPYELAVATDNGLYPTRTTLVVDGGKTRALALALAPAAAEEGEGQGEDQGQGQGDSAAEDDDDDEGGSFWGKPYIATLTIVGFAVVLGLAADEILDDEEPIDEVFASASQP